MYIESVWISLKNEYHKTVRLWIFYLPFSTSSLCVAEFQHWKQSSQRIGWHYVMLTVHCVCGRHCSRVLQQEKDWEPLVNTYYVYTVPALITWWEMKMSVFLKSLEITKSDSWHKSHVFYWIKILYTIATFKGVHKNSIARRIKWGCIGWLWAIRIWIKV